MEFSSEASEQGERSGGNDGTGFDAMQCFNVNRCILLGQQHNKLFQRKTLMKVQPQHQVRKGFKVTTSAKPTNIGPSAKTLKAQLVSMKDSIAPTRERMEHSQKLERLSSQNSVDHNGHDTSRMHWDDVISHERESSRAWEEKLENQRQSLLASSRQIKRLSTEYDHRIRSSDRTHYNVPDQNSTPPQMRKQQTQKTTVGNLTQSFHLPHNLTDSSHLVQSAYHPVNPTQTRIADLEVNCNRLHDQNRKLQETIRQMSQGQSGTAALVREKQFFENKVNELSRKLLDTQNSYEILQSSFARKCQEFMRAQKTLFELEKTNQAITLNQSRTIKELEDSKKNCANLSKILNDSRLKTITVEKERDSTTKKLEEWTDKYYKIEKEKKMLEVELDNISKIKELVKDLNNSDNDKGDVIKSHIAYEIKLIQINASLATNLESHSHDLKHAKAQQERMEKEIQKYAADVAAKIKGIMAQKQKLEQELKEARAQIEKVRKEMFEKYQDIVAQLKDELLSLKEENITLAENSDSKITIAKLEREIKILNNKNEDLFSRIKELEEFLEKSEAQRADEKEHLQVQHLQNSNHHKNTLSDLSSETSIRHYEIYDNSGATDLESIIRNYETRGVDLSERIYQKQQKELELKLRLEQVEAENMELKQKIHFSNRKERSISESSQNQIESVKLQMKGEIETLLRKVNSLESSLQRKNKEIKEKDEFMTKFLIPKVKNEADVADIMNSISSYFQK